MKKYLILITTIFIFIYAHAENSYEKTFKNVATHFQKYFNAGQTDSIYQMFASNMQSAFPLSKLSEYVSKVNQDKGNIIGIGLPFISALNKGEVPLYFKSDTLDLNISLDNSHKMIGFGIKAARKRPPIPNHNNTPVILPFKGQWQCFWGGETEEQNKHIVLSNQRHAFDFVIVDSSGKSFKDKGKVLTDYYAYGQNVYAPANGIVTDVTNGVRDNEPGNLNPFFALGNSLIIKINTNEYVVLAHFQNNSVRVKVGDEIKRGQVLGLCGNSGNTTEPHIHFHLQNTPVIQDGIGIKIVFPEIIVNNKKLLNYSPVKGDKISVTE